MPILVDELNERGLLRTQLVCTFVKKYQVDTTLNNISNLFELYNNKVFLIKAEGIDNELILSYNVILNERKDFLPNSIMVHRKKDTNTLYTINALNELIITLNNGILDKKYSIEWERYRDTLMLKKPEGFKTFKIKTTNVYSM